MRFVRYVSAAALVASGVVVGAAAPAFAAPPANDVYGGRVLIDVGALPVSVSADTTQATTDADDAEINGACGAPATDASVWYKVTASAETGLVADTSASSYSAGVAVVVGSPGSFDVVACGPGAVGWLAGAGTTYSIVVFDDQSDGGGNGGALELLIDEIPPPPQIDVSVNPNATFTRAGSALVSGTVICTGEAVFAGLNVQLSQSVGRVTINGFGGTDVTCDGVTRPFTLDVVADNGRFAGGKAANLTVAFACGTVLCSQDFDETVVHLSRRKA
jgi:hypothetical protein